MFFYAIAGALLSLITWSTFSHSEVTGDYLLSFILLGMMFYVIGQFYVDWWRPEDGPQDFHPSKLLKTPKRTSCGSLWLRVGFRILMSIGAYTIFASLLVVSTTARPVFMILLGMLFLLRMPHLYWSMRSRFRQVATRQSAEKGLLSHRSLGWRDTMDPAAQQPRRTSHERSAQSTVHHARVRQPRRARPA